MGQPLEVEYILRKFAKRSTLHDPGDLKELAKLTEVLKQFQHDKAEALASDDCEQPLLSSYQGDGTPLLVSHTVLGNHPRTGKTGREYYVHAQFPSRMLVTGERRSTVIVEEPRPCTKGKTAIVLLSFALQALVDARKAGHKGPFIFHTGFDRAMNDALHRYARPALHFKAD